ncbi:hypothetical protein [Nonomuraea angiospora]
MGQLLLAGLQGGGEPVDAGCGPGEVVAQPAQLVGLSIADLFGVLELGLGGGPAAFGGREPFSTLALDPFAISAGAVFAFFRPGSAPGPLGAFVLLAGGVQMLCGGLGGGNALQRALLDQLRAARCWPQYAGCRSCRDGR